MASKIKLDKQVQDTSRGHTTKGRLRPELFYPVSDAAAVN